MTRAPSELAGEVRERTRLRVAELGFPEPPVHLPLLADPQTPFELRGATEVIRRLLALTVRVNLALGMPLVEARAWLEDNALQGCLSTREAVLVGGAAKVDEQEQAQVEAIWALAWVLSLVDDLDPNAYCGDHLVALLPDLRAKESADAWATRMSPRLRSAVEVMTELDLLYALTWGLVDARLSGRPRPGAVAEYVHWQRRQALEFTRSDPEIDHSTWDDIDLST